MEKKIKVSKETTDLRGGYIKASDNKKKEQLKNYKPVVSDPENMNPNQSFEFKTDFNNILLEDIDSKKILERNFELKDTITKEEELEKIEKRKQELEDLFKSNNETEKEKNVKKPKDNKEHNSEEGNKVVNRYHIYPNGVMPNGLDINITVDPRFGITYNYDYSKNQKLLRKMIAEQAKEKQQDFGGLLTWYYPNYYYNLTYPYLLNPIYLSKSKTENSKDEQKNKLLTYNLTYPYLLYNPIYNPIYPSKTENSKDEQKNKLLTYNLTYPYLLYNPIYVPYNNLYENMAKQIKNNAQGLKNSRSDDKCKGRS